MAQRTDYPVFPAGVVLATSSLLSVLLDVPPLLWHIRNRNLAAASLVLWITILNFFNFINAVIWPTDDPDNWWPGYGLCDVEVYLFVGSSVALPSALACIMRGLSNVLDTNAQVLVPSKAQRLRNALFDMAFCIVIPILMMGIYYVAQDKRYYVWGISGCNQSIDYSWVGIVVVFLPALLLMLLGLHYTFLVVIRLRRYRQDFARILELNQTSKSRFLRLLCMALTLILGILPVQTYVFVVNLNIELHPYSWSRVHGDGWGKVTFIPSSGIVIFDRWIRLASGILVFVFFGMGSDAWSMYQSWVAKLGMARVFSCLARVSSQQGSQAVPSFGERAKSFARRVSLRPGTSGVS